MIIKEMVLCLKMIRKGQKSQKTSQLLQTQMEALLFMDLQKVAINPNQ